MEVGELAKRVDRLERSNRWLKRWLILVFVGFFVETFCLPISLVTNYSGGQSVQTVTFGGVAGIGIDNNRGEKRVHLGTVSSGSPALHLMGRDGNTRLGLRVNEDDTPSILLQDLVRQRGILRANLRADGRPEFLMTSTPGKGMIHLGFLADGNPILRLIDKDGNTMVQIPASVEPEQVPERKQEARGGSDDR